MAKNTKDQQYLRTLNSYFEKGDDDSADRFLAKQRREREARAAEEKKAREETNKKNAQARKGTVSVGPITVVEDEQEEQSGGIFDTVATVGRRALDSIGPALQNVALANQYRQADGGINPMLAYAAERSGDMSMAYDFPEEGLTREQLKRTAMDSHTKNLNEIETNTRAAKQVGGQAGETAVDIAANIPSYASILGGPLGVAVAGGTAYDASYMEGRKGNLTPLEAQGRAGAMAGVEGIFSAIPAGKFLKRMGLDILPDDLVGNQIAEMGKRTVRTGLGEAAEENLTELGQMGVDLGIATFTDGNQAKFSQSQLPKDTTELVDRLWRVTRAGAAGGAAFSAPFDVMQVTAERGRLAADLLRENTDTNEQVGIERAALAGRKAAAPEVNVNQEVPAPDLDLFGTPEGLPSLEEYAAQRQKELETDAAFAINRRQNARAEAEVRNVEGVRQELDFARQQVEKIEDHLLSTRPRGSRFGLDEMSGAEASTLGAAVSRVRALENELSVLEAPKTVAPKAATVVAPVSEPEQLELTGVTTLQPNEQKFIEATAKREQRLAEAEDLISKAKQEADKKAESKYKSSRQAFVRDLKKQALTMDEDVATKFVADRLDQWESENTVDTFRAKLVGAPKAAPTVTTAPVAVQKDVKNEELRQQYRDLMPNATDDEIDAAIVEDSKPRAPLMSTGSDTKTGVKTQQVLETIAKRVGRTDGSTVAKLIADKNLVVVESADQVPGNAEAKGDGFYDGKRMYVVADKVDPKNVMGSVMSVAAHEVKHAADVGGSEKLRGKFANIVGEKANRNLVKSIENLANGDPKVKQLVDFVKTQHGNDGTYELELPAYFIQHARQRRDEKGTFRRVAGNITAATRTAMSRHLGTEININDNDVAYLSDKLLEEAARDGSRMTGDVDAPMPTVMGKGAKNFSAWKEAGRTYKSVDGNEKFVMSDANAKLKVRSDIKDDLDRELDEGFFTGTTQKVLGDILEHENLYEEYPRLRSIPVGVDPRLPNGGGQWDGRKIAIAPDLANAWKDDVNGGKLASLRRDALRDVLLHEAQHTVQTTEGHARGGNWKEFLTDNDRRLEAEQTKVIRDIETMTSTKVINESFADKLPSEEQTELELAIFNRKNGQMTGLEFAQELVDIINRSGSRALRIAYGMDLERNILKLKGIAPEVKAARKRAHADYMNMLGEREAYFTMDNSTKEQEELPVNPEEGFGDSNNLVVRFDKGLASAMPSSFTDFVTAADRSLETVRNSKGGILDAVKSQLSVTGGLGEKFYNLIERNVGEAAEADLKALNLSRKLDDGIEKMAARTGQTEEQVRGIITRAVNSLSSIDDQSRREAMIGRLVNTNPELMPLMDGMREINRFSRQLLAQMHQMYPDPTPAQANTMKAIENNMSRYFTRFYEAFQGEPGRNRSKRLLNDVSLTLKRGVDHPRVNDQMRNNLRIYNNAVRYLMENDLVIPEDSELRRKSMEELDFLFATWVDSKYDDRKAAIRGRAVSSGASIKEATATVREYMIDELQKKRDVLTKADFQNKAEALIPEMLDINNEGTPIAKFYRGLTEDRTILSKRKDIPLELRELFGEITDPAQRVMVTLSKQGELVARTKLLMTIREEGLGKWVVPTTEAYGQNAQFTVKLSGDSMGPLDGYSTTPAIATVINNMTELLTSTGDAMGKAVMNANALAEKIGQKGVRGLTWLGRTGKFTSVVMDVSNAMFNAVGSPLVLVMQGINPARMVYDSSLREAGVGLENIKHVATNYKGDLSEWYKKAVRLGLLDSVRAQELRRDPQRIVRDSVSTSPEVMRKAMGGARLTVRTGVEVYAMADVWVRPIAFKDRYDTLKKYYELEGISKTESELEMEAANTVHNTTIGYSRTSPGIKTLETLGVTMFAPYFQSVFRSVAMSLVTGVNDFTRGKASTNPEARAHMMMAGTKRIVGTLSAVAAVPMMMKAVAAMLTDDEDEEKVDEMRKLLMEDSQYDDSIFVGNNKNGHPMFFRMARFDPIGPMNDLVRMMLDDDFDADEDKTQLVKKVTGLVFANRAIAAAISVAYAGTNTGKMKDKDTKLERIASPVTDVVKAAVRGLWVGENEDKVAEAVVEVLNTMVPGALDAVDPDNTTVKGEPLTAVFKALGGRLDVANPDITVRIAGGKLNDVRQKGRKEVFSAITGNGDAIDAYVSNAEQEYEHMQKMLEVYRGLTTGMGMSPYKAGELLKDEGRLNATDIAGLRQGRILQDAETWLQKGSRVASRSSIEELAERETKYMTPEEKKEFTKNRDKAIRTLRSAGYKVRD